jgi:hypothetical protein
MALWFEAPVIGKCLMHRGRGNFSTNIGPSIRVKHSGGVRWIFEIWQ